MIVRVNIVLVGLLLTLTNVSTLCGVVIFRVKVSSITSSVDGIKPAYQPDWLSRDVIGRLSVKP